MATSEPATISLPLPYSVRQPQVRIRRPPLLLALHGMSSNDETFLELLKNQDDRFLILAPRGPFPQTAGKSAWYSINWSSSPHANVDHVEYARNTLIQTLEAALKAFKVDPNHVYVFGHSQGGVMALSLLLTRPDLITGAVSVNGQIFPEMRSQITDPQRLADKPLLVIHGLNNAISPISVGRSTSALLNTLPLDLHYQEFHMGHQLSQEALTHAADWLTNQLDHHGILGLPEPPNYKPRLSSVYLQVRNLERSVKFYIRFLGLNLTERVGKAYAFLSSDKSHHSICLTNVGADAPSRDRDSVGLQQVTFEVPDQLTLARVLKTVLDANIEVVITDHLISWGVRFEDPDGHFIEVIWDNRDMPGRANLWQGRDLPLEAEKILSALDNNE